MATKKFTATGNTTVTVVGNSYSLTTGTLPEGVHIYLNELELQSNQTYSITQNSQLTSSVDLTPPGTLTINADNYNSVTYDSQPITPGSKLTVTEGDHTVSFVGAASIPTVTINGSAIKGLTVNGTALTTDNLPYTFTPIGGKSNDVYVTGTGVEQYIMTLTGTNIRHTMINGESVELPFKTNIDSDQIITVDGEVFQVDLQSTGAKVTKDGIVVTSGNNPYHQILDVTKDTYLTVDGTHTLTVTGSNIKSLTVNGVTTPIESLPYTISNNKMTVNLDVTGQPPSTVYVSGEYIKSATLNGQAIDVGANGQVGISFSTLAENQYLTVVGAQPRKYAITWNDNGSTSLWLNGKQVASGSTSLIDSDVYVSSESMPLPLIFDTDEATIIEINGKPFRENDFTVNVTTETLIDVNSSTARVTLDYGDNSYLVILPRKLITLTAPHRDGWLFDGWSSDTVGFTSPKMVQTNVDLSSVSEAHIVAHYQRYPTIDKPNFWN